MIVRSVKDLGALVRAQRKKLGWSQKELADRVGVRRLWVSQIEGGKTTAHIGLVMRTLRALNLDLRVGGEDGPRKAAAADSRMIDLDALLQNNVERSEE